MRARIISEIMCDMACDLDRVTRDIGLRLASSFEPEMSELQPLIAHGLVQVEGARISVPEQGRPYLRLIAAAFDSYLAQSRARHSVAV
jgi:oxygen-independent coproporphyrinogen-3 oxidase